MIKNNGNYYEVKYGDDEIIEKGQKFIDYEGAIKIREKRKDDTDCVLNYEGNMDINGKKEGKGRITYRNGDKYEGEFKNNLKDGEGKYIFKNGIYMKVNLSLI